MESIMVLEQCSKGTRQAVGLVSLARVLHKAFGQGVNQKQNCPKPLPDFFGKSRECHFGSLTSPKVNVWT